MNYDPQFMTLEVNAIVSQAEAVEGFAPSAKAAKSFEVSLEGFVRQSPELTKDLKLEFLGHPSQLCGAGWIEDDLERLHRVASGWSVSPVGTTRPVTGMVARMGIAPISRP